MPIFLPIGPKLGARGIHTNRHRQTVLVLFCRCKKLVKIMYLILSFCNFNRVVQRFLSVNVTFVFNIIGFEKVHWI